MTTNRSRGAAPPLGVMPRSIWLEKQVTQAARTQRLADIKAAILRYREAGLDAKPEWKAELRMLERQLAETPG
jgi:hypothetical protein